MLWIFPLFCFLRAISYLCLLFSCHCLTAILDSYLTFLPQEIGSPVLWEEGHWCLSGYFFLSWYGKGVGPFPIVNLKLQGPYGDIWLRVSEIFSVVRCSSTYPCWINSAFCSLLTWAETKQVKQLITHEAITNSINMVITGFNRGISQFQILLYQEKNSPKRDCSHPEDSLAHSFFFFFFTKITLYLIFTALEPGK